MTDKETVTVSLLMKLLNEQTPTDVPARQELIQKAAQALLQSNRPKRR
jgi:metal-responsive CopG/Arc/MetJ family transcriptional regulator